MPLVRLECGSKKSNILSTPSVSASAASSLGDGAFARMEANASLIVCGRWLTPGRRGWAPPPAGGGGVKRSHLPGGGER
jgi:hypothetical protein